MNQTEFLPELQSFKWAGRQVNIVFDSDIADKPRVQEAETRLAIELSGRGGAIFKVRLPDGEGGEKVGLDDYLLTHSVNDLLELIQTTPQADGSYA